MDRQSVRAAVVAFVVSRLLIFALLVTASQIAFVSKTYSSIWETRIDLSAERFGPELRRMAMVGDAWFYGAIGAEGYAGGDPAKRAFFPLFPLIVSVLRFTGDFAVDAIIVSNAAFLAALLLLGLVARRCGLDPDGADRAVFFAAFFPTSYFCSLPFTESLFLLLSIGAFAIALGGRWWWAGFVGGLAALTRVNGILLLAPLAIVAWQQRARLRQWVALLLIPAATIAFSLFLRRTVGDPLAFVHAQANFARKPAFFLAPLFRYVSNPQHVGEQWNLVVLNFGMALLLLIAGVLLCVRRQWPLGAYTLVSVLLPLTSGSLQSIDRYAMAIFPLFIWMAQETRSRLVERAVFGVSVTLLGWLLAMFTLRVDFALA